MLTTPSSVVVKEGECACCAMHTKQIHHRNFPEIWAQSDSVAEGLAHLTNQLSRARDGACGRSHRESIEQAITDVAEFLETLTKAGVESEPSCRCGANGSDPLASPFPDPILSR